MDKSFSTSGEVTVDAESIAIEARGLSVDRLIVDGLVLSYLEEYEKNQPDSVEAIRARLHEDPEFLQQAQMAALDAIVFSTFANTVDSAVFEESLLQLKPLDHEPELMRMRNAMFDFGIELTGMTTGGSPAAGRLKTRASQFHQASELGPDVDG